MSQLQSKYDLVIIGGGVLGTFFAFHAIESGLRVLLLEKNAAPQGATVRNFGQIVPSGMGREWQRLGRESIRIYRSLQQEFDLTVRQNGSVYLASDAEEMALLEELHQINDSEQYPSELLTPAECQTRYPQLNPDYCIGGLFFPEEISVNPKAMIHRLHEYLSQKPNFECRYSSPVVDLQDSTDGVQVRTTNGLEYVGQKVIICNGSDFQMLLPEVFQASDLQAVKLQMVRLKPQASVSMPGNVLTGLSIRRYESFSECPSWNSIKAAEPDQVFWKQWGVHILFKQEADGGIILGDSHEYFSVAENQSISYELSNEVTEYFIAEGKRIFDLPSWEVESQWAGVYCQTKHPSGVFQKVIGSNIHVVTGIGGKGMTASAGFAKKAFTEMVAGVS